MTITDGGAVLKENAIGVQPGSPVTVKVEQGSLTDEGHQRRKVIPGEITDNGATWTNSVPMDFASRYTLTAQAKGVGGTADVSARFTTSTANNFTMPHLVPRNGEVVGVGQSR